jgi:sulfate adenylyltransferase subunit 2
VLRDGVILANSEFIKPQPKDVVKTLSVRFRTCGDLPITGAVESDADTLEKIIMEVATTRTTERGTRADDKRGETAMEDRKKAGYF